MILPRDGVLERVAPALSHALDPQRFDEAFRRRWRAYLWSCAEVFRSTLDLNLFQVTVSKGNVGTGYPMSRAFLYR